MAARSERMAVELGTRRHLLTDGTVRGIVELFYLECIDRGIPVRELLEEEEG